MTHGLVQLCMVGGVGRLLLRLRCGLLAGVARLAQNVVGAGSHHAYPPLAQWLHEPQVSRRRACTSIPKEIAHG